MANRLKHVVGVFQNVVVPEADDAITEGFDDLGSRGVNSLGMLPSIEFNRDARPAAGEVGDVAADLFLADEFGAFELARAKMPPKALFGLGLRPTKLTGYWRQSLFRQRRSPSPQPSPRRGEGVNAAIEIHA